MRLFLPTVALLLLAACETLSIEVSGNPARDDVFTGIIEEPESRTYLDEQIRLHWTANDLITLFEGITRNKKYIFLGETGDNAGEFDYVSQGFGTGNDLDRYYALYPYSSSTKYVYDDEADYIQYTFPTTQRYAENSVGLGANPMVAITADLDDYDLRFRNVASFLRVCLYGVEQTVGSITLTTNSGEAITGKSAIVPVYGGTPTCKMLATGSTVTLNCDGGVVIGSTEAEATVFWIVVPPITMATGFTVTVHGYYGGEQSFEVASNLIFTRNKYKSMTRELTIPSSGPGMGVGGWGDGENIEDGI